MIPGHLGLETGRVKRGSAENSRRPAASWIKPASAKPCKGCAAHVSCPHAQLERRGPRTRPATSGPRGGLLQRRHGGDQRRHPDRLRPAAGRLQHHDRPAGGGDLLGAVAAAARRAAGRGPAHPQADLGAGQPDQPLRPGRHGAAGPDRRRQGAPGGPGGPQVFYCGDRHLRRLRLERLGARPGARTADGPDLRPADHQRHDRRPDRQPGRRRGPGPRAGRLVPATVRVRRPLLRRLPGRPAQLPRTGPDARAADARVRPSG
jgi:hypothetical protein